MEITLDPATSRIFQDLVEYTQLPAELALRRCNYATTELAVLWQKRKNVVDFYTNDNLYLIDLTKYQLILEHHKVIMNMVNQIKELQLVKILEFGGGLGEFSLVCAEQGLSPTYYDLDGPIKQYALWRFKKHQQDSIIIAEQNSWQRPWDVVNTMDVLEHLENPQEVITTLSRCARYIFCNPEDVKYNIFYPQHISRFDLTPHFERVKGYLWKNKQQLKPS